MSEPKPASEFKPPIPLRATTPESWAEAAWEDPEGLLSDHAHNEKKAALTALSLVHAFSGHPRIPLLLARLAEEELNHFRRVLEALADFGWSLRRDGGSAYAKGLLAHVGEGGSDPLLDRLLVSTLIEARSCERLHLLEKAARNRGVLSDPAWLSFLFELERCEAGHALTYLRIAEDRFGARVPDRLDAWLDWEAEVIRGLPHRSVVH
ncbi:MAG: tRNA-(ms[2]io[6]A)-hydroxylase [Holophagaceae bacterium]|nr:tRNA-(ms[2]io[6]A)-hydroxylase [Holophagaceae bacterium]